MDKGKATGYVERISETLVLRFIYYLL